MALTSAMSILLGEKVLKYSSREHQPLPTKGYGWRGQLSKEIKKILFSSCKGCPPEPCAETLVKVQALAQEDWQPYLKS
jgi:predicted metal-dependent peptidase